MPEKALKYALLQKSKRPTAHMQKFSVPELKKKKKKKKY